MATAAQGRFAPLAVDARAWATLVAAGLADGAARSTSGDRFDDGEVRAALDALADTTALDETGRELLLAWLCALRDHFRERFDSVFGKSGEEAMAKLQSVPVDSNRFLKFRRISIERLARLV